MGTLRPASLTLDLQGLGSAELRFVGVMKEGTEETASTAWFLYSENKEPLGQIHRWGKEAVPVIGARLSNGPGWNSAEVVGFTELRPSCAMRRFHVVIRVIS